MSTALRLLFCLSIAVALLACGRRESEHTAAPAAPTAETLPASNLTGADSSGPLDPYPVEPSLPPPEPQQDPQPYPAPTIPPVAAQDTLPIARSPVNLQVSPDGRYAVYNGDEERDRVYALFSLALDGGAPVQLNALPPPPETLFTFSISPDSRTVIYTTGEGAGYRVPIEGGPSEAVSGATEKTVLSPDGQWLVSWSPSAGLLSTPVGGGPPVVLGELPPRSDAYAITPDSSRVVFVQGDQRRSALYTVPLAGGERVLLSAFASQELWIGAFAITPDSQRVVFKVREEPAVSGPSLASVPVGGGEPLILWDARQRGQAPGSFELSPDGRMVVFSVQAGGDLQRFAVPVEGGAATPLGPASAGIASVGEVIVGDQVVYAARRQEDRSEELYRAPLAGGVEVRLSGPRPFAGGRLFFQAVPRTGRVVFAADLTTPGVVELFSVPVTGEAPTLLSRELPSGASVEQFVLSNDEEVVVFGIQAGSRAALAAVYAARLDGSQMWQVLGGGGIVQFRLLPDGRLLYETDRDRDGYTDLHIAPLGG